MKEFLSLRAAACAFTIAYNLATDASSSLTDEGGWVDEEDVVVGANDGCASNSTAWEGLVTAGGAGGAGVR